MRLMSDIKMKYSQTLDKFIRVRYFTEIEKEQIFKRAKLSNKKSYQQLIINTSIIDYLSDVLPIIEEKAEQNSLALARIEEELYHLCIKINPSLDIYHVTLSSTCNTCDDELYLVEPGAESDKPKKNYLDVEKKITKSIIGQKNAVARVAQYIKHYGSGLCDPERPIGSFIFVGQTGVGKTELAKTVSKIMFGNTNLIRIDCSEYSQPHEYAKLIGAPPGYIGFNEGGYLTEAVKKNPMSVVLFDEIEKAHPKVHNILLQILDEGILTDNKNNTVYFNNTMIIMTSNVGASEIEALKSRIGFNNKEGSDRVNIESEMMKALEKSFRPEFLNRIDELIVFNSLSFDENVRIVDILLSEFSKYVERLGLTIKFPKRVREFLARKGTNEKYGARPLKRAIKQFIHTPLSERILEGKFRKSKAIKTSMKKGDIHFIGA